MKKITVLTFFLLVVVQLYAQNYALDFDGINDQVQIAHNTTLNMGTGDFTVEAWINTSASTPEDEWPVIVGKDTWGTRQGFVLFIARNTNKIAFEVWVSNVQYGVWGEVVNDGKWHHVAGRRSGDKISVFKDGIETGWTQSGSNGNINVSDVLTIGRRSWFGTDAFDGKIDEVRIWNVARTQSQIQDNMYKQLDNPTFETNLVAYYQFNQAGTSTNLPDQSSQSNNGTLSGYGGQSGYWITSGVPMPTDLMLIRNGTLSQTSGGLTVEASSISGSNFVAFGHNNEDLGNLEDCSIEGYNQQLSRVWFVDTYGVTTPTLSLIIEGTPSSSTPSDYGLLISASSDFSSPSEVMTATTVNTGTKTITFEMSGKAALLDGYYTLGSKDGASLPVVLSNFTAQYLQNTPTIHWSTQSETDNMGWLLYRNSENDFSTSEVISDMIEGHGTTTQQQFYTHEDSIQEPEVGATYYYWLESIDYSGMIHHYDKVAILAIPDDGNSGNSGVAEPERFGLFQNEPNPVCSSTRISFNLHETAQVDLSVYNLKGQLVKKLYSGNTSKHTVMWDGKDEQGKELENGVYFYQININGSITETKKLILMR